MDWEAFRRKNKSGKERWSAENYTWIGIGLIFFILLELFLGQSAVGTKYSQITYSLQDNPTAYYGAIIVQAALIPWAIRNAIKRYRSSQRYLKGVRKNL